MKKLLFLIVGFIVAGLILPACTKPGETPVALETPKGTQQTGTTAPSKPDWQQKWDDTLAKAKKEGPVRIYGTWGPNIRTALSDAYKKRYGLDLEYVSFSRGDELVAKFQAEKRAGLNLADVFGTGTGTLVTIMKPEHLLGPVQPLLILPEVTDPKLWLRGGIPYADKDGLAVGVLGNIFRSIMFNTDLIKEGEITSYKDLLKSQYKDKIIMNDPRVTGGGNGTITHIAQNLWGEDVMIQFLTDLVKKQNLAVERDNRMQVEVVARGKYAIGLAPNTENIYAFIAVGAPVKEVVNVVEDNRLSVGAGSFGIPAQSDHPNGTIIFVNWLLGKEGESVFAESMGKPSLRLDATHEGIDPGVIAVPGKQYYLETEDDLIARGKWSEIARKIIP